MLIPLLALSLSASAAELAPTPALAALAQTAAAARAAAVFPSCRPEPGSSVCLTSPDALLRTLTPAAQGELKGRLKDLLVQNVLADLRAATAGNARSRAYLDLLEARLQDPAVDVWRLTTAGGNLTTVQLFPQFNQVSVTIPLTLDALFDASARAHIARSHAGLACDPELILFFDPRGRLLFVNEYQGACHDANE